MTRFQLVNADCRAVMANMGDATVDAIVTDPPYHLTSIVKRFGPGCAPQQFGSDGAFARAARGFMGQTWDGGDIAFDVELWREAFRVLKPGGHVLAFGGTRTYHRLAVAIEDAGFEIRDCLFWLYGSGFPKSHDISKQLDKMAGAERETPPGRHAATGSTVAIAGGDGRCVTCGRHRGSQPANCQCQKHSAPVTPEAAQWQGWGTALKPACEPIVMARKPLERGHSVAANVLRHGTGAVNIDGCRVPISADDRQEMSGRSGKSETSLFGGIGAPGGKHDGWEPGAGRFPANVLHDGSNVVVDLFPREAGAKAPVTGDEPSAAVVPAAIYNPRERVAGPFRDDQGSAARFFYCAKASRRDRDEGCEHLPEQVADDIHKRPRSELDDPRRAGTVPRSNFHPTVKPTDLMRWLCRLVTPPGGVVFDPFTGSGSTGKAALLEGFRFIGAELTPEYVPVAFARLEWAESQTA